MLAFSGLTGIKGASMANADSPTPTYSSSLPSLITLNDTSEANIRAYYSDLKSLDAEERRGENLLKHLKPILQDFTYYSYDNVWKIYEITDREWTLSPASEDVYGGYDSGTNSYANYLYSSSNSSTKNNPYVHTLYRNRDEDGITISSGRIREWGDHSQTGGTNREHVWCQSRGFKASNGAEGPAGTDIHHLMSGDGYVNGKPHNNNPYGYVDPTKITIDSASSYAYCAGNLAGKPLHPHSSDEATTVFEPQDSDKGDIARACFYMVACYNNLANESGVISQYNPNLTLADYATSNGSAEASSDAHPVAMGILSDLLQWHRLDPVDEFEIHRNNLIYENYQHNRNPFIDFPQWVDLIWGDEEGSADPSSDGLYGEDDDSEDSFAIAFHHANSDSNTALTTSNFLGAAETNSLFSSVTATSKCYPATLGLKMGTGSESGSFTADLVAGVSSIKRLTLASSRYGSDSGKLKVTINGETILSSSIAPGTDYTYLFPSPVTVTSIKVETTSNRAYLDSLTLDRIGVLPESISLSASALVMDVGDSEALTASIYPAENSYPDLSWTSGDANVATVSSSGLVSAIGPGCTDIQVKTNKGGYTATCLVTVLSSEEDYKIIKSVNELMAGASLVIGGYDGSDWFAAKAYDSGNNLGQANAARVGDYLTPGEGYSPMQLGYVEDEGFTLKDSGNKYLYAASTSNNYLKGTASLNGQSYWNIALDDGVFALTSTAHPAYRGLMRYNKSSDLFSCYGEGNSQEDVYLFVNVHSIMDIFLSDYLHMDDYSSNLGYCADNEHHYFATAKETLLGLGKDYILLLQNDPRYEDAKARYEAWAEINGQYAYEEGEIEIDVEPSSLLVNRKQDSLLLLIGVGLTLLLGGFILLIAYKKVDNR